MRKKILFAPLWGIFVLSLLSSCRTEDGAIQQKQIEDNRFSTFVPKSGKTINYADGFAYLMKRYDNLHKTNLSGINNKPVIGTLASNDKSASVFQNGESYVESNIRSQTITEQDDIKWVAFPKVKGNKVVSLVVGILSEKGTRVTFRTFVNDDALYKQNIILFQAALDRRLKRTSKLALNASLNSIALADPEGCSDPYSVNYDPRCKDIEEVIINIPKPLHKEPGQDPPPPPINPDPDGRCADYGDCSGASGNGSGGGDGTPNPTPEALTNKEIIDSLRGYPCAQDILRKIPDLNSSLSNLVKNTFKNNDNVKVTFVPKDFTDSNLEGHFIEDKVKTQTTGIIHFNIEISTGILQNATQEYVLSVMYHELVHAYLAHEWNRLGADAYHQQYPYLESYTMGGEMKFRFIPGDHQAYTPFINMIADAIQAYNPNFPKKQANHLAMGGLTNGIDEGIGTRKNEKDSNNFAIGTKCSKSGNYDEK
ncbi:hypothetical protein [Elizabethkingia anophelis]|uniref:hypothetical protein n=1 Tax=Elizabethkingia anophelis TaxID=1117645 RepID=UPI00040F4C81|nr:hypothetical protein [Elizabethkingia anophelis]MDC8025730.1 hypothetical protein [Elizabethkingia anophelis]